MNSLKNFDLIDLYYPTSETVAALLAVPPEQREALLRHILTGTSATERNKHIAQVLARIEEFAGRGLP